MPVKSVNIALQFDFLPVVGVVVLLRAILPNDRNVTNDLNRDEEELRFPISSFAISISFPPTPQALRKARSLCV